MRVRVDRWSARPFCAPKNESFPISRRGGQSRAIIQRSRTLARARRTASGTMIRLICPHCHVAFLRVTAAEDGEEVVCPHCGRSFIPDEEEWVDPEDE